MKKLFTTYEQSVILKEIGFNEPCFGYHKHTTIPNKIISNDLIIGFIKDNRIYNDVSNGGSLVGLGKGLVFTPTKQQAFRWFRDRFKLHSYIEGAYPWFRYYINSEDDRYEGHKYLTYEEAESACIDKLIGIVKKNS